MSDLARCGEVSLVYSDGSAPLGAGRKAASKKMMYVCSNQVWTIRFYCPNLTGQFFIFGGVMREASCVAAVFGAGVLE